MTTRKFKRYTMKEYVGVLASHVNKVKFTQIHVHHTWLPNHTTWKKSFGEKAILGMYNSHIARGFADIAQHVTIDPDGFIWDGRNLSSPPVSATNSNDSDDDKIHPFMFEMIGDFDTGKDKLQGKQLDTMLDLIHALKALFKLSDADIKLHRELQPNKTCPGSGITRAWLLGQVNRDKIKEEVVEVVGKVNLPKANVIVSGVKVRDGVIIDGTTYIPARVVSESLGATVLWDNKTKTITINK